MGKLKCSKCKRFVKEVSDLDGRCDRCFAKTHSVVHWLNHGCYPGYTCLIYAMKHKEAREVIKETYKDDNTAESERDWLFAFDVLDENNFKPSGNSGFCSYVTLEDGDDLKILRFIWINNFDFTTESYAMIAHEVMHLCQFFLPTITPDREKEMEAHFHTYMMTQIIDYITGKKIELQT